MKTQPSFTLGPPQALLESPDIGSGYKVSADGQRSLTIAPVEDANEEATPPKIRIVQNWSEEFRDREQ